eukprot:6194480-Pleurochrysis_carterae.AAC.3
MGEESGGKASRREGRASRREGRALRHEWRVLTAGRAHACQEVLEEGWRRQAGPTARRGPCQSTTERGRDAACDDVLVAEGVLGGGGVSGPDQGLGGTAGASFCWWCKRINFK